MRVVAAFVLVGLFCVSQTTAFQSYATDGSITVGKFDPRRILCPVLAALYNSGDLKPDVNGSVELNQFYTALHETIWDDSNNAMVQAMGISDYDITEKETQVHRNRCLYLTPCWLKKQAGKSDLSTMRWLNIFTMNGRQSVEHGFSTGTRGGATNVPEFDYTGGPCNGTYPCEERFEKFYKPCADENGRFYLDNIKCVICRAQSMGDRGGEMGTNSLQGVRQWQMIAAMTGWLAAFGRLEADKDPYNPKVHFEMEDVRAMIMEGQLPPTWERRHWGAVKDFPDAQTMILPCADEDGNNPPWWQDTSCPSFTGETCTPYVGWCSGGASCMHNGRCVCGLGSNDISMCAVPGENKCEERVSKCTYFGEPCQVVPADNPAAPF